MVEIKLKGVNLLKRYGPLCAIDNVTFELAPGDIVGLLGHNGAGKSTLVRILAGDVQPDTGDIWIDGSRRVHFRRDSAIREGVVCVYQEGALSGSLSALENAWLLFRQVDPGERHWTRPRVDALVRDTMEAVFPSRSIAWNVPVWRLQPGDRQLIEICRAIAVMRHKPGILILDEATSSIGAHAAEQLYGWLHEGKARSGITELVISHRLGELRGRTDRMIILRNGSIVKEVSSTEASKENLITLMTGDIEDETSTGGEGKRRNVARRGSHVGNKDDDQIQQEIATAVVGGKSVWEAGETIIRASGLRCGPSKDGVTLEVRRGEMVGLGGLVGQGQIPLLEAIFLQHHSNRKALEVNGKLAYVSGDRIGRGVFPLWSVGNNLAVSSLSSLNFSGVIIRRRLVRLVQRWLTSLKVRGGTVDAPIGSLSGGSQQKILIARAIAANPLALLLDDPTRGVDPATKREVMEMLRSYVGSGACVLWYSSESEELLVCDRVYILLDGRIATELVAPAITEEEVVGASFAD